MSLSSFCIKRPVATFMLFVSMLVLGGVSMFKLPLELFPRIDFPFIGVYVPYPNAIPSQVEENIAKPIEEVLSTLGGVEGMFSGSTSDDCFVGVRFYWGKEVDVLRLEVREKVDQIRSELPPDVRDISIFTFNSSDSPVMVGRISAKGRDLSGSYSLIEKKIINPLSRIEGVGQVNIDGVAPREVAIYLHMDKVKEHRIDIGGLFRNLQAAGASVTVGKVTEDGMRVPIRTWANIDSYEELGQIPLGQGSLRLEDVATVAYEEPLLTYGRHLNQDQAIAFWIQKESGANVVDVARRLREKLDEMKYDPALKGVDVVLFWDQSEQIMGSLSALRSAGIIGGIFAVFVLFFFLRSVRSTMIIATAIPFSIIAACCFLFLSGRSLNILTMMGLMLAVGMLVDNAVVVLESIHRHQCRNGDPIKASILGAREVGLAVFAATSTSIIVFAPVVFTADKDGLLTFLAEVGVTISVTLALSLLISLTLIPLMSSRISRPSREKRSRIMDASLKGYVRALKWTCLKHRYLTGFLLVPVATALTIGAMKVANVSFDDNAGVKADRLYLNYEFTDNLNYKRTEDYVSRVEDVLMPRRDEFGVKSIYSYYADNAAGTTLFFEDTTMSDAEIKSIRDRLREVLPDMPGCKIRLGDEEQESAGAGAKTVQVTVWGEDSRYLEELSMQVRRRLSELPYMRDLTVFSEGGKEEVKVVVNDDMAPPLGLSPLGISQVLGLTFRGARLPDLRTPDGEVEMNVVLQPEDRQTVEDLKGLTVSMNRGIDVQLGSVAEFAMDKGPGRIYREDQKAAVTVSGAYEGPEPEKINGKVAEVMNSILMPTGYTWSFGQQQRRAQQQQQQMLVNIILALACVYLVMAALFESLTHPLVIMTTLPFAFIGVIWTLVLWDTPLNIMTMIGMVILIGIVVNNGIVLLDHINNYRRGGLSVEEAILEGGKERFRPILMTAATTILGLMPMALGDANIDGLGYYPLARSVMGGLAASTILTLLVLPTFYAISEDLSRWRKKVWALSDPNRPRIAPRQAPPEPAVDATPKTGRRGLKRLIPRIRRRK
jgi:HAE1 family hydrophobic/amphiphilic exporter-1